MEGKFWYGTKSEVEEMGASIPRDFEHEIMVQVHDDDGALRYEFGLRWHDLPKTGLVLRVEVFEDGLRAFKDIPDFWEMLADHHDRGLQPDETARMLAEGLGYDDITDYPGEVPYEEGSEERAEEELADPEREDGPFAVSV